MASSSSSTCVRHAPPAAGSNRGSTRKHHLLVPPQALLTGQMSVLEARWPKMCAVLYCAPCGEGIHWYPLRSPSTSHSTVPAQVTAQSQHSLSTITAQSQHLSAVTQGGPLQVHAKQTAHGVALFAEVPAQSPHRHGTGTAQSQSQHRRGTGTAQSQSRQANRSRCRTLRGTLGRLMDFRSG